MSLAAVRIPSHGCDPRTMIDAMARPHDSWTQHESSYAARRAPFYVQEQSGTLSSRNDVSERHATAALPTPAPGADEDIGLAEWRTRIRLDAVVQGFRAPGNVYCGGLKLQNPVIDPPPIVQVTIEDPTASEREIDERIRYPFSVMNCRIFNEAGDEDMSAMPEDFRQQRRLMGTIVSSPFVGKDENDLEGCFFAFPDLSVRTPGSFRLQFQLVLLNPQQSTPGCRTPVCATAMSDVFTVYNAKDFPGMKASTALTKRLKAQGCPISIKKGNERNRQRDDSEDDDDDDEDDNNGGRRAKRPRRT
ncbi:velvet factor-domain-containing protein [Xylariaceae sp. FL0804]|nr:velvet factor-domain-containing protein [Xylariaceae sp. FL0804]